MVITGVFIFRKIKDVETYRKFTRITVYTYQNTCSPYICLEIDYISEKGDRGNDVNLRTRC